MRSTLVSSLSVALGLLGLGGTDHTLLTRAMASLKPPHPLHALLPPPPEPAPVKLDIDITAAMLAYP